MDVSLSAEQLKFIEAKLKTGRYESAADVVRDGLRVWMEQEAAQARSREAWSGVVREKIEEGWGEAQRGEHVDGDEAFDRLRKKLEDRRDRGT